VQSKSVGACRRGHISRGLQNETEARLRWHVTDWRRRVRLRSLSDGTRIFMFTIFGVSVSADIQFCLIAVVFSWTICPLLGRCLHWKAQQEAIFQTGLHRESTSFFTDFTVPGLGIIVGPEKPFEPEVLAHISRNYER